MKRADLIAEHASRLPSDLAKPCLRIVQYILESDQSLDEITLRKLAEIAKLESREALMAVAGFLTARFRVLSWNFVYFSEDGQPHYLSAEEAAEFVQTGTYIDPDHGPVEDAGHHVFPYFSADKKYLLAEVS